LTYSKTTEEIIRELNELIANAKETAESARKNDVPEYIAFWDVIADATDAYANKIKNVLDNITAIAERPDEITNRFAIIKAMEGAAFNTNMLAFNAGLMISRASPEHNRILWPTCLRYIELARLSVMKAAKASQFLSGLSALIFEDMRRSAAEKMQAVRIAGKEAAEKIGGYLYIKHEVAFLADLIASTPVEDITLFERSRNRARAKLEDISFFVQDLHVYLK
jgi:hypothetical protein